MSYEAPFHVGVVVASKRVPLRDVAFWVEAVAGQLRDHAGPAWGLPPAGVELYTPGTYIPSAEGMIVAIVDDDGDPEAAGYHNPLGGVVDLSQSASPSRTLSHEILEMFGNWKLDRWSEPDDVGRAHALELCDAVQRSSYYRDVEMFDEVRKVEVADFVYPAWFDRVAAPARRFCQSGLVARPFELAPGGYSIARVQDGSIVYLASLEGMTVGRSKVAPSSRTTRIVQGAA